MLPTRYPLIQAPMAGCQGTALAIAVSQAGGLGSVPAAMLDAAGLAAALSAMQATGLPYNVNFFCHEQPAPDAAVQARWQALLMAHDAHHGIELAQAAGGASRKPFDDATAEILSGHRPNVVSFHFGLPRADLLKRVKQTGALVMSSATTVAEAQWLQARGADAVIAQGLEAGGHRGHFLSTDLGLQQPVLPLVSAIVQAVHLPVFAAGGIVDAAGVAAAMASGAAAVQCGTAFLLSHEATTSPVHRARLRDPDAPTALTNLFSGGLARGLENRLMRELGAVNEAAPPFPLASAALAPLRARAESTGLDDYTPLWSGTHRQGLMEAPAAQIVEALAKGFVATG